MFIDINYNKKLSKVKLHLAKPNKKILSPIPEFFNGEINFKLGAINELKFSIPYSIEDDDGKPIYNEHIDSIKEKMLIRFTLGRTYKEWFIVDEIKEDAEDEDVFNVTAYSLGYELGKKRISDLTIENETAINILDNLLEETIWSVGEVDRLFDAMFRTFESGSDSNVLNCINNLAETFGGLIVWDTVNRIVSLKDISQNGRFRGLTVRHDRLVKSISKTRTTDEMVTRMYIEGNEGLTIHSENPTGQGYLEDFSYFMYPFEADENGNVIKSSHYMSDELCLALISHERIVNANSPIINNYLTEISEIIPILTYEETYLSQLRLELDTIQQLLDLALATENAELISQRQSERSLKQGEVMAQEQIVANLKSEKNFFDNQIEILQGEIQNARTFTPELVAELDPYIIESVWRDDRYIDAKELFEDGIKKFAEVREPKIVVDTTIDNLLDILEEQYFWDKLQIGDYIKVKHDRIKVDYMAKIMEMTINLDDREINLVISNQKDLLNETEKLVQMLYDSKSATSLVQNNKYKWDKVHALSERVLSLVSNEWDATKNKIIAGINNSVEIGKRGIMIKNPDFPNEVVIMQSGVIALSRDGGETWKTAIKPDGIVAERLIGQVIVGQQLLITNSQGTFTMDENGAVFDVNSFRIVSGSGSSQYNLIERWQNISQFTESLLDDNLVTSYEKSMLQDKWKEIASKYQANESLISQYFNPDNLPDYVIDYNEAYDELYKYLFVTPHGDYPLLAPQSMEYTTQVLSSTFKQKFEDYNNSIVELEKQFLLYANNLANEAYNLAQEAKENIDEVIDDVVYKIEIHSSNGFLFRNGDIQTTVTARIYRGKEDVTATIPQSVFKWRKFDKDGVEDLVWNQAHVGVGNVITITNADVLSRATFRCDADIN